MSKKQIEECVRASLEGYFKDLRGTEPDGLYEMMVKVVEKPLLETVMAKADQNALVAAHGGRAAALQLGKIGATPVPGAAAL